MSENQIKATFKNLRLIEENYARFKCFFTIFTLNVFFFVCFCFSFSFLIVDSFNYVFLSFFSYFWSQTSISRRDCFAADRVDIHACPRPSAGP